MITATDIEMVARLLLAFVLAALPGFDREQKDHPAGLRTHMLVAAGAACFTMVGIYAMGPGQGDWGRIAAQVVTGVGFLGAGSIVRDGRTVRGLTTAASIWMAAALGMLAGAGLYLLGIVAAVSTVLILRYAQFLETQRPKRKTLLRNPSERNPSEIEQ